MNWSIRKDFRGNQRFGFSRRLFTVAILLFLVFAFSNPFFSSITFSRSSPVLRVSADSTPIWPTFQHDSQRSSLSSFLGPTFNTTDWVFGPTGAITNSPVIGADGTVYVVDSNSTLFAINPDGSLKWEKTLTENLFTPVIAPSGVIYVPGTRHLYAFNPDGSSPWAAPYNISSSRGSEIAVSPTGIIFEIDSNGTLHAINPLNTIASSIWTTNVGCIPSSLAVSSSGNIYCGTGENGTTALLYSIDSNGHIMWSLQTKSPVSIPPAVYGNGTIYAITSGGEILAISQFGIELWSISTVHMEETSPVIGPDGTIYVAGSNVAGQSVLVAISQAGTINWSEFCFKEGSSSLCIPFGTVTSMAIDSTGTIYVGTNSSGLFSITSQGGLQWSYAFQGSEGSVSPQAIGANGTIFVGTSCLSCNRTSGHVYAIGRPAGYSLFSVSESGLPIGTGWSFLVAGRNYTTSAASLLFSLPSGNFSWVAPPSEVFQSPGVRYSPAVSSGSVGVPSTQSLNFVYSAQYQLNLTSSPVTGGIVNESSGWYQSGSMVAVVAVSYSGYQFGSWQTTSPSLSITNSTGSETSIFVKGPGTAWQFSIRLSRLVRERADLWSTMILLLWAPCSQDDRFHFMLRVFPLFCCR